VYAQQCVQLTGTNRPRAWINHARARYREFKVRAPIGATFDNRCSGGHSGGVTPVPIPNTEVKPASADGTWGDSPWESRSPPDFSLEAPHEPGGLRRGTTGNFVSKEVGVLPELWSLKFGSRCPVRLGDEGCGGGGGEAAGSNVSEPPEGRLEWRPSDARGSR
jgi:hypothetical protein